MIEQKNSGEVPSGVQATCNLLAAISAYMMTTDQRSDLRIFLSMFEPMNKVTIVDPVAASALDAAIEAQRMLLDRFGGR